MRSLWIGALSVTALLGASVTRAPAQAPPPTAVPETAATRPATTTGKVEIVALESDGSPARGVRLVVSACWRSPAPLFPAGGRLDRLMSMEPSRSMRMAEPEGDEPAIVPNVLPGVPFVVIVLDSDSRGMCEVACAGLQSGETRLVTVSVPARSVLAVRVLDDDEHPVAGANVEVSGDFSSVAMTWPWSSDGTTDAKGESEVSVRLAPGPARVSALAPSHFPNWMELSALPGDGSAVVIHLRPMHPVLVHAVDRNSRPVPLVGAILIEERGAVSAASPRDEDEERSSSPQNDANGTTPLERAETEWWRLPHVPEAAARVRVFPLWGVETELPSSRDTIRAVLSTHIVLTVSWDDAIAARLGPTSAFRLAEDKRNERPLTGDERARHRADLALPIGRWTLRLQDAPDGFVAELRVDVRTDTTGTLELHAP
ncbi:MAG TPA: Ig-like domain-containing protein [Planctomycetota bacterium]|nr:Ig-like domain-containing protein [Planctomycetota bacterium]